MGILGKYYFVSDVIFSPLTQTLISTKDLLFNDRVNILNYISACGYTIKNDYCYGNIYIPQDVMIKQYLIKKNTK